MTTTTPVSRYMATKLVTAHPEMSIHEAMSILITHDVSGLPVVGDSGELVGMLSERDCLRVTFPAGPHHHPEGRVKDYMSHEVRTIDADADIVQAIQTFLACSFRRLPVLDDGRLVGQLSRRDAMRALPDLW
ncbi:MAG: CBS domain-containing protein [Planctomycetes bacterium]|nr:CBS domain-containing protein [Planctomycetota bacterium]